MTEGSQKNKADLKVVLLGAPAVGKTTMVVRYIEGSFQETIGTIGASFFLKRWGSHNIAIWDTAGGEKFSGLSSFYCRKAGAAILAYDICSMADFQALRDRFLGLLSSANEGCLLVVVGTKSDLLGDTDESVGSRRRQVTASQGREFAKEINENSNLPAGAVPFFETSSKTGEGINELFQFVFEHSFPSTPTSRAAGDGAAGSRGSFAERSTIVLHDSIQPARSTSVTVAGSNKKCCGS